MSTILTNSSDRQTKPSFNEKEAYDRISRLPKIFIASSSKAIEQAREIKRRLDIAEIAQVTLWQDSIPLSEYILDGLRNFAATVDFAVVLFTGDDEMAETGALDAKENPNSTQDETLIPEKHLAPRDNCIFELGLFMGALGLEPRRALLLKTSNSKLLSDLGSSYIFAEWPSLNDDSEKREATIQQAINKIKKSVLDLGYCFNHPPRTAPRIIPKDRLMDLEKRKPGGQLLNSDAVEVLIHVTQPLELDHDLAKTVCENMRGDISYCYFFYAENDGVQFFSSLVSTLAAAPIDPTEPGPINIDGWRDLMQLNEDTVSKVLDTMRKRLRIYFKPKKPDIEFCVHNARHENDAICYLRHSAESFVEWYKGKSAKYIADELKSTCPPPRRIVFQGSGGWHLYDEANRKFLDLLRYEIQGRFPDGALTNKALEVCFGDKPPGQ